MAIDTELWLEKIHPMDNIGHVAFEVKDDQHELSYYNRWETCGIIREVIECSCGFYSESHTGGGCWQWGHDKRQRHSQLDMPHAKLMLGGVNEAKKQFDVPGSMRPMQWQGLAYLILAHLGKQKGSMHLMKQTQRLAAQ